MNGKILYIMLIIGMIFSISSVCAADLNGTQFTDHNIQNDNPCIALDDTLNSNYYKYTQNEPDVDCNDNSTDNTTETDSDYNYTTMEDLNIIGVLPLEIGYDIEPILIENAGIYIGNNEEINAYNAYIIKVNFYKSPHIKNFNIKVDVDGKQQYYNDTGFDGSASFRVGDTIHDFNKTIVTVSYTINGKTESQEMTFEKSYFKPNSYEKEMENPFFF